MDQWKTKLELHQHQNIPNSHSDHREMSEVETNDARKVQKADREKLRRDRLNEQFVELGNVVDPDRPKNDKASILIDTIQVLKDLTTEVNRRKSECTALSEESCELTHEKNELREEKSSLKFDIENLNAQYQQRAGVMFPWGAIDPSSVMMQPPYSFPVALPVHSGPVPVHPFPFFANHNAPGAGPTSSPAVTYPNPVNAQVNQTVPVYAPTSYCSSNRIRVSNDEKGDNSSDVVTELELKTPGSRSGQESESGDKKGKQSERKEKIIVDGGCSSNRYTSTDFQDSSSNSVVDNDGGSNN